MSHAKVAEVYTEYAFRKDGVVQRITDHPEWNEWISLHRAAQLWYDGAEVVTRTSIRFEDRVGEWEPMSPQWKPGEEPVDP